MDEQINPIFSGGVGRSGTTIVGRILRKNSQVFVGSPFEIKFITEPHGLIDLVFGIREFLPTQISSKGYWLSKLSSHDSTKVRYLKFRRRIEKDWWIRTNRLERESGLHRAFSKATLNKLLKELEACLDTPVEAARQFTFGYVQSHRKWQGQKFWMDTSPPNIMYSDYIYRIFPEARFVEMVRNPLDNIASVLKESWGPNDPKKAILWWHDRVALARSAQKTIPIESSITLELEDLVKVNRIATYQRLLSHIGLEDEVEMREYFDSEVTFERAHIGRWRSDFADPDKFENLFNQLTK